ncbi:MAG: hypothetical protein SFV23_07520 [Planctomycetaceae bacterium]|nr:hypothetical protein [Planctomycetaceae bacterium]
MLLADLGIHHLTTTFEQIRFLQSHLWKVKQRHSPIDTILSSAMRALEDAVHSSLRESPGGSPARRVFVKSSELQESLEEAVFTCGLLEQLARAAQGLFDVTPFPAEEARRFLAPSSEPGFFRDVLELGDRLQAIRIGNMASTEDVEVFRRLRLRVLLDLWDESLPLQRALRHFVVPLRETLVQAMTQAAKSFAERNHPWQHAFERCLPSLQGEVREWRVLVDHQLLREVLRNLCTNVRHTFSDLVTPDASVAARVEWQFREFDEVSENEDRIHFVEFEFRSIGRSFDAELFEKYRGSLTLSQHIFDIRRFGGSLTITAGAGGGRSGCTVVLRLVARDD